MKKKSITPKAKDELQSEYDLTKLGRGVRGKYYQQATAGSMQVLIAPDPTRRFRDGTPLNRARRLLVDAARTCVKMRFRRPKEK